jgi:hypothetical protein
MKGRILAGTPSGAFEVAVEAQHGAIYALAQYALEHQDDLREALVRGRKGDRKDLADELRELLAAWSTASTAVRDAVVAAGRAK